MRQALRCALYTQTVQGVSHVSAPLGREEGKSHSNGQWNMRGSGQDRARAGEEKGQA